MPGILASPLTKEQINKLIDEDDAVVDAVIEVSLSELVSNDIEGLNDLAQERVVGDGVVLVDIGYQVAGSIAPKGDGASWTDGTVLLRVTARLDPHET